MMTKPWIISQEYVAHCAACDRDVVTFEPIPGERLDCVRCGAENGAMPVLPLRRAWFAWTETPTGRWGVIRDDYSVAYPSEAAVRAALPDGAI